MSRSTSKLGLTKPGGGSTGQITPPERVDIDVLNANFDRIDAAVGAAKATSTSRPSQPFDGQLARETDTKRLVVYDAASSQWVDAVFSQRPSLLVKTQRTSAATFDPGTIVDLHTVKITSAPVGKYRYCFEVPLNTNGDTQAEIVCRVTNIGSYELHRPTDFKNGQRQTYHVEDWLDWTNQQDLEVRFGLYIPTGAAGLKGAIACSTQSPANAFLEYLGAT